MNEKLGKTKSLKGLILQMKYKASSPSKDNKFPLDLFDIVLRKLMIAKQPELNAFAKYLSYSDMRYFFFKFISEKLDLNKLNEKNIENLIGLLCMVPDMKPKTKTDANLYAIGKCETDGSNILKTDVHRKLFSDCVFSVLKYPLTDSLFKQVLKKMPTKILPKMSNPLILSDFLTQSYNMGGIISVLALNSLFVLITQYNLEYPKFYEKVYEQLDNSIFHTNYKERYYYLLDTFLSSSHLSVNLVASFIKKISRLVLTCPAGDIVVLLRILKNLFVRHPNCKVLLHSKSTKSLTDDPFDVNSTDFEKTNAIQSSIWEVQALKNHYLHEVVSEVAKVNETSSSLNSQADSLVPKSYEEIIDAATISKFSAPFNFECNESTFDFISKINS